MIEVGKRAVTQEPVGGVDRKDAARLEQNSLPIVPLTTHLFPATLGQGHSASFIVKAGVTPES